MNGNLLDTSVLIAVFDGGIEVDGPSAISVVTVGELRAGVELAKTPEERSARQLRLNRVSELFEPIPVGEAIALEYGKLLALARKTSRIQKATDLLIASTAAVTGRTLVTRDESQASLAREAGLSVKEV